jgi:hypothetical protein
MDEGTFPIEVEVYRLAFAMRVQRAPLEAGAADEVFGDELGHRLARPADRLGLGLGVADERGNEGRVSELA